MLQVPSEFKTDTAEIQLMKFKMTFKRYYFKITLRDTCVRNVDFKIILCLQLFYMSNDRKHTVYIGNVKRVY